MLTEYDYKILRFLKRRGSCTRKRLEKKFGPGVIQHTRSLQEYIYSPHVRLPDGSCSCKEEDIFLLTDSGLFALDEYSFRLHSSLRDRIIGFISGILASVLIYLFTEFLLPLILR